ncbi:MAG: FKBP-type peptidyl-prolyl cis-trans isomerase [Bacteroidales bacterium]|jgi:FKBP-type peptidyl-prolyl cis-trans isomerase|nr:FKBP-type peptidyl-prolyl cis-trans isomerase [Bacteroidales bacterium]
MKIAKLFAIASAAVLVVACGSPKVEGSKEVRDLLPSKGQVDTTSYLLGVNFGLVITQNNFGDLNMAQLEKGIKDALNAKEGQPMDSAFVKQFKIDPSDMNMVINNYLQKRTAYEGALNKEKGDKFRREFYEKNSADSTASGIVYLIQDSGSEVRATSDRDTVKVNYRGTLIDGTEFDKNEGIEFPLNRVIPGWTEGMKLVGEGGKITLVIPAEKAYGERGPRNIGTNATLVFDVDLLEVKPFVEKELPIAPIPTKKK